MDEGQKLYKCTNCDDRFMSQIDLNQHKETVHKGTTMFKCNICNARFSQKCKHI